MLFMNRTILKFYPCPLAHNLHLSLSPFFLHYLAFVLSCPCHSILHFMTPIYTTFTLCSWRISILLHFILVVFVMCSLSFHLCFPPGLQPSSHSVSRFICRARGGRETVSFEDHCNPALISPIGCRDGQSVRDRKTNSGKKMWRCEAFRGKGPDNLFSLYSISSSVNKLPPPSMCTLQPLSPRSLPSHLFSSRRGAFTQLLVFQARTIQQVEQ